ncbi:Malonyl-CoA decarboxylase-domain-containing protein [Balamuthia mandrillaris]
MRRRKGWFDAAVGRAAKQRTALPFVSVHRQPQPPPLPFTAFSSFVRSFCQLRQTAVEEEANHAVAEEAIAAVKEYTLAGNEQAAEEEEEEEGKRKGSLWEHYLQGCGGSKEQQTGTRQSILEAICQRENALPFLIGCRQRLLELQRQNRAAEQTGDAKQRVVTRRYLEEVEDGVRRVLFARLRPEDLKLERLTVTSPSPVLSQVMTADLVHPMERMEELQRRLGVGKRCFAFFHPLLPNLPLAFVHASLHPNVVHDMQTIFKQKCEMEDEKKAEAAVFYSIHTTQPGLKGMPLGGMLIKAATTALSEELNALWRFATLSPIPGFRQWLREQRTNHLQHENLLKALETEDWFTNETLCADLQSKLMPLCAHYILQEKATPKNNNNHNKEQQHLLDPVANFHVGHNKAHVLSLNWRADLSKWRMGESFGVMANYSYRPSLEEREALESMELCGVPASRSVIALLSQANHTPKH